MKALIAGWFSFEQMGATAGDLIARDIACDWLARGGWSYDVAHAAPFEGGVNWRLVDPRDYAIILFVCGPCGNGWPFTEFLAHFKGCRLVGLNLSMIEPTDVWNPFAALFERDSPATARPDLTLLGSAKKVPVAALVLRDAGSEYGAMNKHEMAHDFLRRLAASREMSIVTIDTRLDRNSTGLRTSAEVESLIARMDVVLTTRLHGLVLAIKNGVPALVVDSITGTGKVWRQAQALGWPLVFNLEMLSDQALNEGLDYCLSEAARVKACECRDRARQQLLELREAFTSAMAVPQT